MTMTAARKIFRVGQGHIFKFQRGQNPKFWVFNGQNKKICRVWGGSHGTPLPLPAGAHVYDINCQAIELQFCNVNQKCIISGPQWDPNLRGGEDIKIVDFSRLPKNKHNNKRKYSLVMYTYQSDGYFLLSTGYIIFTQNVV